MSENAVEVVDVSKVYKIYNSPSDRLKEFFSLRRRSYHHDFWALRNVSISIERGERVGIIGTNGSGKSTLLQIVAGVLQPTSGYIKRQGRVSSLLELGAGFNPEFTGRSNVYMNGALMGFSRLQMDAKMGEIEAFADIGEFVDQPVKTYSSGMYLRLAFASAIHVDPDILIVDEALSVGDMFFQAKCMTRMKKMIDAGVTILFVSHDMGSVKGLCTRALWLEHGETNMLDSSEKVVNNYQKNMRINQIVVESEEDAKNTNMNLASSTEEDTCRMNDHVALLSSVEHEGYGNKKLLVDKFAVVSDCREKMKEFDWGTTVEILCLILAPQETIENYSVGFLLRDMQGIDVCADNLIHNRVEKEPLQAGEKALVSFRFPLMIQPGVYSVTLATSVIDDEENEEISDWIDNVTVFNVVKAIKTVPDTKVYIKSKITVKAYKDGIHKY